MHNIPEDIMNAAHEAWRDMGFANDRLNQVPVIARAILAERERSLEAAAKVAEGEAHEECDVAEQIAKFIRALTQSTPLKKSTL